MKSPDRITGRLHYKACMRKKIERKCGKSKNYIKNSSIDLARLRGWHYNEIIISV